MDAKFVLQISGPGCAGKSSLAEAIGSIFPGTYYLAYDRLKWQLSGYNRDKDRQIIHKIQKALFDILLSISLPIVTEMFLHDEDEYREFQAVAARHGYAVTYIALTAPRGVLVERFRARIKSAEEKGTKISLTNEELFIENLSRKSFVPTNTPEYDTSITDVKEIAAEIANKLRA